MNTQTILGFEQNEINEHYIYLALARLEKQPHNKELLGKIAADELRHYEIWRQYSGRALQPNRGKIWWYSVIARILGLTFAVKIMEAGEKEAQANYGAFITNAQEAAAIKEDELAHEQKLIGLIDEEKLKYIGSVVLGLNDALVEFTGMLAGLTFALQHAKIVGVAGLITGVAASLSMAASEYLSTKAEGEKKSPLLAAFYTGVAYVIAVTVLVFPYLLLANPFVSLFIALLGAGGLIYLFSFYYAIIRGVSFRRRFIEMATITFGVAFLSFLIGLLIRLCLGVSV